MHVLYNKIRFKIKQRSLSVLYTLKSIYTRLSKRQTIHYNKIISLCLYGRNVSVVEVKTITTSFNTCLL